MTNKFLIAIMAVGLSFGANAQDNMSPAPAYKGTTIIKNGNVHTGTGVILSNTSIKVENGKITGIGQNISAGANDKMIDATGKEVYPGLILSNTAMGLREIVSAVRGSNDYNEIGDINPNVRAISAYNANSKITNVVRTNGVLLAQIVPEGNLITGTSSVVQLDAWSFEDAVYNMDQGLHIRMPSLLVRRSRNPTPGTENPLKRSYERIEEIKTFLREAKAYQKETRHEKTNLKFEAVEGIFNGTQTMYVHCNLVKEMLVAIDFAKEFKCKLVLVGASESYQIAPLLRANNVSVILEQVHRLPTADDDDVDQPFKTPAMLQAAGVDFCLTDTDDKHFGRNLPFNAGTAVAYGLTKEQALSAITINAAKILNIDNRTGSIEIGKDANIIVSTGDILDMRTNNVTDAMIQGRILNLDDKQKQLNKKYSDKYARQ